ncbi:Rab-GTPase-TBC domain-containing protein 10 [Elsinoe australis]|uniref:Rab-GTPase-TBC domain-containing protein 10 n=1 Tax=Elsinoe australis TaxID=40998 RepID=A0A4U7ANR8_9PEZI|nr:Rab-GTPase-TBC domain-containing protein 10 [Elsinoe australis]
MGDSGPPTSRRNQSSRRPSAQRNKTGPRGRRSNQSLTSTSQPEETPTLTSFRPFSSPKQDDSDGSCSSSKRSRSIYAPNRQNSVDGEQFTRNDDAPVTPHPTTRNRNDSKAAKSLMNAMMDTEGNEGSLFNEHDLQYFRHHPNALAHIDNKSLRELSKNQSYFTMIRTLAGDLAQRDAETVAMRKRLEELGKIFKDHLCSDHDLSRLDADRTLRDLTKSSKHPADLTLQTSLEDAVDSPVTDAYLNPFSDNHVVPEGAASSTTSEPRSARRESESPSSQNSAVRGMLSMFGGRGTVKSSKANKTKKKEVPLATQLNSAKAAMYSRRKSSIGSNASSKNLIPVPAGPVEMNSIVETENLPPPLTSQRDIQAQYPGYSADVYGFVIDSARINEFIDKNRVASPKLSTGRGADTPITSASSIKSIPHESETEGEAFETENSSWTSYLKFDASTLGSLSWLPIASTTSTASEEVDAALDSPTEMGQTEAVKLLQTQLADDFSRLQKARLIPWEKFLAATQPQASESSTTSYVPALFRRNTQSSIRSSPTPDIPPQLTSLPPALRAERTRLVLSGIPMALRSQIYTSLALETLQPDPDEYASLVSASSTSVEASLLAEIEDDIPRTLPNNVFFRPSHPLSRRPSLSHLPAPAPASPPEESRGRAALRELLLAFLTRRPEIGYCQGMNLIAGYLLLISPTTEAAFWVFVYLIEHVLADIYFDATLRGASIEICVLRSYIDELVPRLGRRLGEYGVEGRESAPYNWFLTAYASALGVEGVFRVWDVLLGLPKGGGSGFLVRVGVGMCKAFEEDMLGLEGGFEVRGFMDGMGVGGVQGKKGGSKGREGGKGISIDGLVRAAWILGGKIKDEEVRRRRKYFALKVDESALG